MCQIFAAHQRLTLVFLCLPLVFVFHAGPARAGGDAIELMRVMKMREVFEVLRDEGNQNGRDMFAEAFPGRDGSGWDAFLEGLYHPGHVDGVFYQQFSAALEGVDISPMIAFFTSETGRRIITLELSARRAMLDEAVTQAAQDHARAARQSGGAFVGAIDAYIAANDLIESNVQGALNSNLMFLRGINGQTRNGPGGGDDGALLREVWSQEDAVRRETEIWVDAFLFLAYGPVDPEALAEVVAFSRSTEGLALNAALFVAFDAVFAQISYEIGVEFGRMMLSDDI